MLVEKPGLAVKDYSKDRDSIRSLAARRKTVERGEKKVLLIADKISKGNVLGKADLYPT